MWKSLVNKTALFKRFISLRIKSQDNTLRWVDPADSHSIAWWWNIYACWLWCLNAGLLFTAYCWWHNKTDMYGWFKQQSQLEVYSVERNSSARPSSPLKQTLGKSYPVLLGLAHAPNCNTIPMAMTWILNSCLSYPEPNPETKQILT